MSFAAVAGAIAGPVLGGILGGGSGGSPGYGANMLAGGLTAQRIPGQTQPGAYTPDGNSVGSTYNYIPTGAGQIDPQLIQMIMSGLNGGSIGGFNGRADDGTIDSIGGRAGYLLNTTNNPAMMGRGADLGLQAGDAATGYGRNITNYANLAGTYAPSMLTGLDDMVNIYRNNPFMQSAIQAGGAAGDTMTGVGGNLVNQGAGLANQYQSVANNALSNPFAPQAIQAAGQAGGMMQGAGQNAYSQGGAIGNTAMQGLGAANSVLNTAFDPQQALYDRTLGQTKDQLGTFLADSGLTNSGAGAKIYGDALSNFNIDWQNNQLGRQTQGLSAFNSGVGGVGQNAADANQMQTGGAANYYSGGALPYETQQGINANQLGTLGQLSSGLTSGANLQGMGTNLMGQGASFGANNYSSLYQPQQAALNDYATNGAGGYAALTNNMSGLYGSAANQLYAGATLPSQVGNAQNQGISNYLGTQGSMGNLNNQSIQQALSYLQAVMTGSNNAANATKGVADTTGLQNYGAQGALAPLIQGGFNGLQSLFGGSQPNYGSTFTNIGANTNNALQGFGFG